MKLFRSILSLILLGTGLFPAAPVSAQTEMIVNTATDETTTNGLCSLREAIHNANNNLATYPDCRAGLVYSIDAISFAGDYVITLYVPGPFAPASIEVTSRIIINGNGVGRTVIQVTNCNPVTLPGGCTPASAGVFFVRETGDLTLNGLTVRYGNSEGGALGGGIINYGTLTVTRSRIANNSGSWGGGGIHNEGTLTVTNSTITNNRSGGGGSGGIHNYTGTVSITDSTISSNIAYGHDGGGLSTFEGTVIVTNSTISGNYTFYNGGGINNTYGILTVTNSTISGNETGNGDGGGIFNNGTLNLINSTIANNIAPYYLDGGGLYNLTTLDYRNTLIADNTIGGDCANFGTIGTNLNNLVEDNFCFPSLSGDPNLGALANNGGATQTHALLTGSPAIDAGSSANCPATDQRGVARPQGEHCDIGAYEAKLLPATSTFGDVPTSHWAWEFIERLYAAGITGGCGSGNYCPSNLVTRAQMAVFLLRGIHGASYVPPAVGAATGFSDVPPDYWAAAWIRQLAAEGITTGCGGGHYCPERVVTRAQMAVFLLRSKYGSSYIPPTVGSSTGFTDVDPSYWAAAWIKQLVAEGITSGCGTGTYCPESPVTRAQMAVFLVRTFNLP